MSVSKPPQKPLESSSGAIATQLSWMRLISNAADELRAAGVASPEHDARELAAHVCGVQSPSQLDRVPVGEQLAHYREVISRRCAREPLQHIIGTMYFRHLELESKPGVFVVRPETEMVAQAGIDFLQQYASASASASRAAVAQRSVPEQLLVIDLFSGSGAIALSIATELQDLGVTVYGVELSDTAYTSELRNNARYGDAVTFIHADALESLPDPYEAQLAGRVALVIANPPYVPLSHELSAEVCADPQMALFGGGEDGLEIPMRTIKRASELLAPGGALVMEHASEQSVILRKAAEDAGFVEVSTGRDLVGSDRWLFGRHCPNV